MDMETLPGIRVPAACHPSFDRAVEAQVHSLTDLELIGALARVESLDRGRVIAILTQELKDRLIVLD